MNLNVLKFIPKDIYYDMNTLINNIQNVGLKIEVFPVSEKSWFDVGQWKVYSATSDYLLDDF